ncbi:hypothetical protein BB560_003058, partial [Smittium megazygosporum]
MSQLNLSFALLRIIENDFDNGFPEFLGEISNISTTENDQTLLDFVFSQIAQIETVHEFLNFFDELNWLSDPIGIDPENNSSIPVKKNSFIGTYIRNLKVVVSTTNYSKISYLFQKISKQIKSLESDFESFCFDQEDIDKMGDYLQQLQDPKNIENELNKVLNSSLIEDKKKLSYKYTFNTFSGNFCDAKDNLMEFFDSKSSKYLFNDGTKPSKPDIFGFKPCFFASEDNSFSQYSVYFYAKLLTMFSFNNAAKSLLSEGTDYSKSIQDFLSLYYIQSLENSILLLQLKEYNLFDLDPIVSNERSINGIKKLQSKFQKILDYTSISPVLKLSGALDEMEYEIITGKVNKLNDRYMLALKNDIFYNEAKVLYGRWHYIYSTFMERQYGNMQLKWLHLSIAARYYSEESDLITQIDTLAELMNTLIKSDINNGMYFNMHASLIQSRTERIANYLDFVNTYILNGKLDFMDQNDRKKAPNEKDANIFEIVQRCISKCFDGFYLEAHYEINKILESDLANNIPSLRLICTALMSVVNKLSGDILNAKVQTQTVLRTGGDLCANESIFITKYVLNEIEKSKDKNTSSTNKELLLDSTEMRAILQRVQYAKNIVNGQILKEISTGVCVYIAVAKGDTRTDAEYIANRILGVRVFDENGTMWKKSVSGANHEIMCLLQQEIFSNASN